MRLSCVFQVTVASCLALVSACAGRVPNAEADSAMAGRQARGAAPDPIDAGGAAESEDSSTQDDGGEATTQDGGAATNRDGGAATNRDAGAATNRDAGAATNRDAGAATSRDGGDASSAVTPPTGSGCGSAPGQLGLSTQHVKDGAGTQRSFDVFVPSSYDRSVPRALVFAYHGAGGDSAGARGFGFEGVSGAASGAIFVYPQGIPFESFGLGWNDRCSGYDMPFFDNMLAALKNQYCIDERRIFAAGFSWGCDHVTALACCRGQKLRAVGAASCSDEFGNASDYRTYDNLPCPSGTKPAVRFTHDVSGDGAYSAAQFSSTSALFRSLQGCSSSSTAVMPSPCVSYGACAQPVVECAYPGIGHAVPPNFAAESWSFFSGLP